MTIPSEISRSERYLGNGVTTIFPFHFRILDAKHVQVLKGDGRIEKALILDRDYTVKGVGGNSGSITLKTALPYKKILVILRQVPFVQETDFENQGAYYAETVEGNDDYLTMQTIQLKENLDRAIVVPLTSDLDPSEVLTEVLNAKEYAHLAEKSSDASAVSANEAEYWAQQISSAIYDFGTLADKTADDCDFGEL